MKLFPCLVGALLSVPVAATACDLALILAVDVSGSVDPREYHIQMQGLAEGLRDAVVSEALVRGAASVAVVQWTGSSRQIVSVPWHDIRSFDDVDALALVVETTPREWRNFSTAIGEAMRFSLDLFEGAPDCARRVLDVSGDGSSNEGITPQSVQGDLRRAGVTVNALVIEGSEPNLTAYYWENVITGEAAFVVTANGYGEYAQRMRAKLRREAAEQVSDWPVPGWIIPVRGE